VIITRTPFRISFAGGGSDLPAFYRRHAGCVLSVSINKYMYITIHPSFNRNETLVKYSKTEIVKAVADLKHPIARGLLQDYNLSGVEITSTADVPSGTGLSTSSAYTVGLIHALSAFTGKYRSQESIAEEACELEIEKLGDPIGKQDQYGVSVGGLKFIQFNRSGDVNIEKVILRRDVLKRLESNLLLFYTGESHSAGDILEEQIANINNDENKFNNLIQMTELTKKMHTALIDEDLSTFGDILHRGWMLKKQLASNISLPVLDRYYEIALNSGARGGKLLGAGGGGFLLFYCEPDRQGYLREALSNLVELPFSFENGGTKVIYVDEKNWN
jgi:D-glycero-alpha-D-manno-heptose-7-phosphate kinase